MLLLLLCTLSLGQAPREPSPRLPGEGPTPLQRAAQLMQQGGHAKALRILPDLVDEHPAARPMLLRAQIATGQCSAGIPGLERLPGAYDASFAENMARCHATWHQWSQAADWMLESDSLARTADPDRTAVIWHYLSRAQREEEAAALHAHMQVHAPLNARLPLMQANLALHRGQTDRVDQHLRELEPKMAQGRVAQRIQARLELDLGNPAAASEHARAALRSRNQDPIARSLLAESLRRSGWPEGAERLLVQSRLRLEHHPDLQAIHMRVLVDQGRPEQARAFHQAHAAQHQGPHPELIASLWYIAQSLGEQQEAERLAAQWALWNQSPLRSLEQL